MINLAVCQVWVNSCFDACQQVDDVDPRKVGPSPGGSVKSGPQLPSAKQLPSGPVTRSRQVLPPLPPNTLSVFLSALHRDDQC